MKYGKAISGMKGIMGMAGILMILVLSPAWSLSGEPELEPSPTTKIIWKGLALKFSGPSASMTSRRRQ
jgi:hypothetical protein